MTNHPLVELARALFYHLQDCDGGCPFCSDTATELYEQLAGGSDGKDNS